MTRRAFSIAPFVAVLALVSACGKEWKPPVKKEQPRISGQQPSGEGGFGSERDPSRRETYGTMVVKSDSFILRRQTDYKNYARAVMVPDPKQEDIDTYEVRVSEGRYIPIPAGTKVTRRGSRKVQIDGKIYEFINIEVADGSITDESGMGQRGNVPADAFK